MKSASIFLGNVKETTEILFSIAIPYLIYSTAWKCTSFFFWNVMEPTQILFIMGIAFIRFGGRARRFLEGL